MKKIDISRKCVYYTENDMFPFCSFYQEYFTITTKKPRKLTPQCWRCKYFKKGKKK